MAAHRFQFIRKADKTRRMSEAAAKFPCKQDSRHNHHELAESRLSDAVSGNVFVNELLVLNHLAVCWSFD
jgi:hypothetical protein